MYRMNSMILWYETIHAGFYCLLNASLPFSRLGGGVLVSIAHHTVILFTTYA